MKSTCIVGIAGGTASGKTTLARMLFETFGPEHSCILELDSYYRSRAHLSLEERASINYDHPDAFEFELLVTHLRELLGGVQVRVPVYDFALHSRHLDKVKLVEPRKVVLVEGILSLACEPLRALFDLSIFVDAPPEMRLERRMVRDIRERGRTRESVLTQWEATVHPMHQEFCEPTRVLADTVLDGASFGPDDVKRIGSLVRARLKKSKATQSTAG